MKKIMRVMLLASSLLCSGCSVILGPEDSPDPRKGLALRFVETLRNEASLRGESLREVAYPAPDRAVSLQLPNSVFADGFRVYVTDIASHVSGTNPVASARVFIFDRGERKVTILQTLQAGNEPFFKEGMLLTPGGITVDPASTIWVSDSQQGRVFGYSRAGSLLYTIGRMGELARPVGVAADYRRNRLYVADAQAHQIKVFHLDGTRLFEISSASKDIGDFKFPGSVTFDKAGNLYVLDNLRHLVVRFDADGNFSKKYDISEKDMRPVMKPSGIAVDSDGHLYVTDLAGNNIHVFDREGLFLFTWGRTGQRSGDFWSPAGIFIDERDYIYIADQTNSRVQVFQYSK